MGTGVELLQDLSVRWRWAPFHTLTAMIPPCALLCLHGLLGAGVYERTLLLSAFLSLLHHLHPLGCIRLSFKVIILLVWSGIGKAVLLGLLAWDEYGWEHLDLHKMPLELHFRFLTFDSLHCHGWGLALSSFAAELFSHRPCT